MTTIALLSIAMDKEERNNVLNAISTHLASTFDASIIVIGDAPSPLQNSRTIFDEERNQSNSEEVLRWLAMTLRNKNNTKSPHPAKMTIILGICNFDAYSSGLNFVFGQASPTEGVAAIYLPRLRQQFYGLSADRLIFTERVLKEATHELGHAFGLTHCSKQFCVMHFSNSLADTDRKAKDFCNICRNKLY
jgi:archaemetzincin